MKCSSGDPNLRKKGALSQEESYLPRIYRYQQPICLICVTCFNLTRCYVDVPPPCCYSQYQSIGFYLIQFMCRIGVRSFMKFCFSNKIVHFQFIRSMAFVKRNTYCKLKSNFWVISLFWETPMYKLSDIVIIFPWQPFQRLVWQLYNTNLVF